MKPFELPSLDPASLAGYRQDDGARKRFERKFMLPSLLGVILCFGSVIAHLLGKIPENRVPLLVFAGFAILMVTLLGQFLSHPVCSCAKPMKKYWNSAPKPGNTEAVYVCEGCRTYFIRVWGRSRSR